MNTGDLIKMHEKYYIVIGTWLDSAGNKMLELAEADTLKTGACASAVNNPHVKLVNSRDDSAKKSEKNA